jgi:branched-chain amino acid transport system substrate-binding protein
MAVGLLPIACGNRRPASEDALARLAAAAPGSPVTVPGNAAEPASSTDAAPVSDPGEPPAPDAVADPGAAPAASPSSTRPSATQNGNGAGLTAGRETPSTSKARGTGPSKPVAGGSAAAGGGAAASPAAPAPGGAGSVGGGPKAYDQGASDTEVVFGSVSSMTGLFTDYFQPQAARAYFKYVNSQGGVNGRQLKLLIYDDQWDVSRHASLVRQAVETDKVFAFTAMEAILTEQGGVAYLDERQIPVIGGEEGNLHTWGKSPMYFTITSLGVTVGGRAPARYAYDTLGCRKFAGISMAADESRGWVDAFKRGMQDKGVNDFVYRRDIGFAEVDYTAYVIQARDAGAECVAIGGASSTYVRWAKAASQQGFKATNVFAESGYDDIYLKGAEGLNEGDYIEISTDILENAPSNPAMAEYVKQVARFEPRMRAKSTWAIKAWLAGKATVEALRRMGNNLTRANLIATLHTFKNWDTGMSPPVTWNPGPKPGAPCINVIQIKDKAYQMLQRSVCV